MVRPSTASALGMTESEWHRLRDCARKLSEANADDYLQEVAIKLLTNQTESPFAFALTAIKRIHLDIVRTARHRYTTTVADPPAIAPDNTTEQWIFEQVVGGLTEQEMAIYTARIEGVRLSEITKEAGLSESEVKHIMRQIKKKCTLKTVIE